MTLTAPVRSALALAVLALAGGGGASPVREKVPATVEHPAELTEALFQQECPKFCDDQCDACATDKCAPFKCCFTAGAGSCATNKDNCWGPSSASAQAGCSFCGRCALCSKIPACQAPKPKPTRRPFTPSKDFQDCLAQAAQPEGGKGGTCQPLKKFECDQSCSGYGTCCGETQWAWGWICPQGWAPGTDFNNIKCTDCLGGPWGSGCGSICAHDVMRCHARFDCDADAKAKCTGDTPICSPSYNSVNVQNPEPKCVGTKPTKPTRRPGPRPTKPPGKCTGDVSKAKLLKLSGGEITGGCEQLYADYAEQGKDCDDLVNWWDPSSVDAGKPLDSFCCATCASGVDPIAQECSDNEQICIQDMKQADSQCGEICVPEDRGGAYNIPACRECAQEVFGDELRICSCCITPFVDKYGFDWPRDLVGDVFPCEDAGRH